MDWLNYVLSVLTLIADGTVLLADNIFQSNDGFNQWDEDWEHPLKIEQHKAYALDTNKSYTEYLLTENTEENGTD